MVYTIGFGMRNSPDVVTVIERNTAKEALELAEALEQRDEEIRFIDTPTDGRVMTSPQILTRQRASQWVGLVPCVACKTQCTIRRAAPLPVSNAGRCAEPIPRPSARGLLGRMQQPIPSTETRSPILY